MKFKGFWKSLWELNKQSLAWFKDYWLAYILLFIIVYILGVTVFLVPAVIDELESRKKLREEAEKDVEDFLE